MAKVTVKNSTISKKAWGDVDKSALGNRLATLYADGNVTKAQIREVYAYVPDEAFGKDAEGKRSFAHSKAWGPHHEVRGTTIVLSRGGVHALAGALAGARAKPSLSGAALTTAKRHARKHYRHLKEDVPESLKESLLRRVGKGKALTELVKGSLDYTMDAIRRAFYQQHPYSSDGVRDFWLAEIFADHVIVNADELAPDEYYYVSYEKDEEEYVFAARDEWEVVELTYQPQSVEERKRTKSGKPRRFVERTGEVKMLEALEEGGPRRIKAVGITADVVNGNGRRYPATVLSAAVEEAKAHLHESLGQGRLIPLLGEAEHPSDKASSRPSLLETVVKWEDLTFDGKQVLLEGIILGTSKGRDVEALMEGGVMPGVSQRGYGESRFVKTDGQRIEEVTALTITGYDLVLEPSDPGAGVTVFESKEGKMNNVQEILEALRDEGFFDELSASVRQQVEEAMKGRDAAQQEQALRGALGIGPKDDIAEAVLRLVQERKQPAGKLEQQLRESLKLSDTDNLEETLQKQLDELEKLREAERQRQVAAYIEEQVDALEYPDWLKKQFREAVQALKPKSQDAAKGILVEKRKEYDGIMTQIELASRGYPGLRALGPVLESETGTPEFARGAHLLTESMVTAGKAVPRKWNRPLAEMSINERFAKMLLEKYDLKFQQFLMAEAKLIEEAEQTSDLSLPYSVARAVIAEAVPDLVAVSIFDVGLTDQAPSRIYYEVYAGETGASATATDESVTMTALDTWYELDYKRVQPGTVTVTDSTGAVTYEEGTDYVIDYANGEVEALTGGGITAGDAILVDYTYDAVRLGEMAAIEQAKLTLDYKTLEIAADRLATEISTEAVVFARSQIGWDATGRTLAGLVRKVQELIDRGLLYMGLTAALSVANNSGGTWSASPVGVDTYQENLDKLFRYIGVAKVKVANRYYEPTFILASVTNGDLLSNSEQFTAAGARPDSDLNAAGYVGRAKGLPVFESTQFSDGYILVGNRELVMHRVFQPMVLKGPYPSYSSNKLVASEQYYAEEFNGTDAPVPEKGSYVKLTA